MIETMATRRIGIDWTKRKAYKKAYYQTNREQIRVKVRARRQSGQEDRRSYSKAWYEKNKEQCQIKGRDYRQTPEYKTRHKLYQRVWRANTPAKQSEYCKKHYEGHKDTMKAYSAKRMRERRRIDHVAALECRIRARIYRALRAHLHGGTTRKVGGAVVLVGCTMPELAAHLEAQFLPGMSWQNRREWHVDHKRPCASFNLSDPAQQLECFHFNNLQPLWATDNRRKSSKWNGKKIHRATASTNPPPTGEPKL